MHKPFKYMLVVVITTALLTACSTAGGPVSSDQQLSKDPLAGKFVWHDLITDDIAAARRFYAGLFGWEFENSNRPGSEEPYVVIRSGGTPFAGMVELSDPEGDSDYSRWLGYISVEDVDASAQTAESGGGKVLVSPRNLGKFARVAAIQDPQGAVVGLVRSHVGDPVDGLEQKTARVVWNELLAADSAKAGDFYRSLAGYQVKAITRRGGEYTLLQSGRADRAGILQRPADEIEPLWLTYFAVSDVVSAAKHAEQLGGKILLAPADDVREGTVALVTDPNGAVLALKQWPHKGEQ